MKCNVVTTSAIRKTSVPASPGCDQAGAVHMVTVRIQLGLRLSSPSSGVTGHRETTRVLNCEHNTEKTDNTLCKYTLFC